MYSLVITLCLLTDLEGRGQCTNVQFMSPAIYQTEEQCSGAGRDFWRQRVPSEIYPNYYCKLPQ